MQKLFGPLLFIAAVVVGWTYFAPSTVPAAIPPGAVDAGRQTGQTVVDTGTHFYSSPYFWPVVVSGGLAAVGVMFWRNIGQRAKIIVCVLAAIVVTLLVVRGAK